MSLAICAAVAAGSAQDRYLETDQLVPSSGSTMHRVDSVKDAGVTATYDRDHGKLLELVRGEHRLTVNQPLFDLETAKGESFDSSAFHMQKSTHPDSTVYVHKPSGLKCEWRGVSQPGTSYLRHEFTVEATKPVHIEEFRPLLICGKSFRPTGSVLGSPLTNGNWYAAIEYPMAFTRLDREVYVQGVKIARNLKPGDTFRYSTVYGERGGESLRRAFLSYLENERARPYRIFLHYNSWYDICHSEPRYNLTSENCIRVMNDWQRMFTRKYGVKLDSFVFDDGWDDYENLWQFRKSAFPQGFSPQAELAKEYETHIGTWLSPFGGYGSAQASRIENARKQGYEVNAAGLSLAGENYYRLFLKQCRMMMREYEVNYFKFDGLGGADPAYLPDVEAAYRLMETLRKDNPDIYINLTTGTWASPFFLLHGDSTWRGGGDVAHRGSGPPTQKWLNYRDGETYTNIVRKGALFPLNSLMTCGIVYANRGEGKNLIDESDDEFAMQAWTGIACGTQLQELYISADRMNDAKWKSLADAAKWGRKHEATLRDTHWIGGDPNKEEMYGWASLSPDKNMGIICLRNPAGTDKAQTFDMAGVMELAPADWKLSEVAFSAAIAGTKTRIDGDTLDVGLPGYSVVVIEVQRK